MREELEQALADRYWFMRREREEYDPETGKWRTLDGYNPVDCSCGDGWYRVLEAMCAELAGICGSDDDPKGDVLVSYIKEKWGVLDVNIVSRAWEDEVHDRMWNAVQRAEEASRHVCEHCGRPGVLRDDLPWISTLCNRCLYGDNDVRRRAMAKARARRKHVFGRRRKKR